MFRKSKVRIFKKKLKKFKILDVGIMGPRGYFKQQEFTDFLDSTGREIYEGDIFQGFCEMGGEVKGEIIFKNGKYLINEKPSEIKCVAELKYWHQAGKIIGNIFENPGLIK